MQRALPVPAAAELRVRMGVHTGEPVSVDGDLHGRTVVKAARIAGLARGGEVLASTLVRDLAATEDGVGTDAWFEEEREVELRGMRGRHPICALAWEAERRRATRVVVADDSAVVRDGVAAVLRENGIDVTATASDAESLYRAVNRHRPDVALVDIRMPPTGPTRGSSPPSALPSRIRRWACCCYPATSRPATRCGSWRAARPGAATCSRTA